MERNLFSLFTALVVAIPLLWLILFIYYNLP
jgi:ABC-type arginine transport system permease subunit